MGAGWFVNWPRIPDINASRINGFLVMLRVIVNTKASKAQGKSRVSKAKGDRAEEEATWKNQMLYSSDT